MNFNIKIIQYVVNFLALAVGVLIKPRGVILLKVGVIL